VYFEQFALTLALQCFDFVLQVLDRFAERVPPFSERFDSRFSRFDLSFEVISPPVQPPTLLLLSVEFMFLILQLVYFGIDSADLLDLRRVILTKSVERSFEDFLVNVGPTDPANDVCICQ
jgi:hypothetical protein